MALQNAFGDLALDATLVAANDKLDAILAELLQKFEAGEEVALDAATIAALQNVFAVITNFPTDFPDAAVFAKLEEIRALLGGTLTINLPSGAATGAKQDTGNTSLASIDAKLTNPLPVSGTVTTTLPSGAATSAKQDTGNTSLASIDAKLTNPLPISAAALPLPSGAATGAKQDTANTSLASIDGKLANPLPVAQSGTWTMQPGNTANTTPWQTFPPFTTTAGAAAQTAIGNNVLNAVAGTGAIDLQSSTMGHIQSIYIQFIVSGTITAGTLIFEGSNDNFATTGVACALVDDSQNNGTSNTAFNLATGTNRFYSGPTKYRYFRVRISTGVTGSGGSVQAIAKYSTFPYVNTTTLVNQPTTSTFQVVCNLNSLSGTALAANTGAASAGTQRNILTNDYLSTVSNRVQAATSNGTTTSSLNSANTTNATLVKNAAGAVFFITAFNASAATKYLKLYNKASAPAVGTDIPIMVIAIPATASKEIPMDLGLVFSTGIAYALTGGAAVGDTTALAAGDVQLSISWI